MKKFAFKAAALIALNVLAGLAVLAVIDARHTDKQWETDSILYVIPRDTPFDLVTMGTSRARVFSEFKNNCEFAERELGARFLNLAIPFGGGIRPEKMFLENFFDRGNTAKAVVLFLDPFMLFADDFNKYHRFVFYEPFRIRFLIELFQNDIPIQRIITYIRSKFGLYWIFRESVVKEWDPRVAHATPDEKEMVRKRIDSLYPEGLSETAFSRYTQDLDAIFKMVQAHGARMIVVFAPTLLGPEPGAAKTVAWLEGRKRTYPIEFHDFTNAMQDYAYFADHDHLNTKGFEYFVTQHLKPILQEPQS